MWIKSQPGARIPRAGRPNSVTLPRTDPGDDSVPDSVRVLPKFDAIFVSVLVDQADLDARRSWAWTANWVPESTMWAPSGNGDPGVGV